MEVKANVKYIRMSPRKVRVVVDLVRALPVDKALAQLQHIGRKAAEPVAKLIKSAIANAANNYDLKEDNLFVKEIKVDQGPTLKRWMPRAHGRATPIMKRTSHISVIVAEVKDSGVIEAKKQKVEAPIKLDGKPKEDDGVKVPSDKKEKAKSEDKEEKGKAEGDPKKDGRRGHAPIEGGSHKGFASKMFRRKSG